MTWFFVALAALLAYLLTAVMRRYSLSVQLLDYPNVRSSHSLPTPRGGGLGIVVTTTLVMSFFWLTGRVDAALALAMTVGGGAVAAVGFADDRGSTPVFIRLAVHAAAAVWATYLLGGLSVLSIGSRVIELGIFGNVLGALAVVWALNLFNFMDGIDGIAASEAIFVTGAGAALTWRSGLSGEVPIVAALIAAASFGFLLWNWPPARIFMGDVGSGYLGYVIGVMILASACDNPSAVWVWLILGGVFFVDATVTLVRRTVRRERIFEAHRGHAYQWLARRWGSHRPVTIAVMTLNLLWLLPWAFLAVRHPSRASWIALVALLPLIVVAIAAGAGRRESI